MIHLFPGAEAEHLNECSDITFDLKFFLDYLSNISLEI